MRTYAPSNAMLAPKIPLHLLGYMGDASTDVQAAGKAGAPIAGAAVTSAISSSAATSGSAFWGAAAGPIGAAAAVAVGIIVGMIAAHYQRLKDAKNENAAAAQAVSGFYSILQQIVSDYNAGKLAQPDAIAQLESLDASTYAGLKQHVGTPGTAWGSSAPGVCDKSCTVGCCLYNTYLHPDLYGASGKNGVIPVMQAGGGTMGIAGIPSNKYGFPAMAHISLTINPPSATGSINSAVSSVESALGGGGSILPLLLLGVGAFLVMR